jgi:hypothetical protein
VVTLASLAGGRSTDRILIKLDIEGMEIEALDSFVPREKRAVLIVGELHNAGTNLSRLKKILENSGWTLRTEGMGEMTGNFVAWSPAASSMVTDQRMAVAT